MNTTQLKRFLKTVEKRTQYERIKGNLTHNIAQYAKALPHGKGQFTDFDAAKQLANQKKRYALAHLPALLEMFEQNARNNGIEVLWAEHTRHALTFIDRICVENGCKTVVKSKSMTTEELHLNPHLEKRGIAVFETDLGEYIQQLSQEPPIHILTPAMHKKREEVAALFREKFQTPEDLSASELTAVARKNLREKFVQADAGITGANFILPDIGGIALTENEGNARLSISFPKIHIVVAGIEKMLPSYRDLALFWPLLSTMGTGQYITSYSSVVTGARRRGEIDGPEKMYVILLDNGRSAIYQDIRLRESLFCIRCGACLNACPVYVHVAGGHAYGTTYTGPIGSVIAPHLQGMQHYGHLSYASSLCGACSEVCPVKIPIHQLLLYNRTQMVQRQHIFLKESILWGLWSWVMRRLWLYVRLPAGLKNWGSCYCLRGWHKKRTPLIFPKKTFRAWYRAIKRTTS